jgi:hypothetical protein
MSKPKPERRPKQSDAFIEAARAAECDEDEAHFEERLKRVIPVGKAEPKKAPK